jgi:spermidine synthase
VAIATGAFLLFGIQPIAAKRLLPWFGGSAAVWITCLVFFQIVLLAGYLYAHALSSRLSARAQAVVHVGALLVSLPALLLLLWTGPPRSVDANPTLDVLRLLAATVGLPYVLLASTSPLLQAWLARRPGAALPYRLYALSNLGSLVGLLGYPVLIEPFVPWRHQALGWAAAYAGFVGFSTLAALRAAGGAEGRPAGEPASPGDAAEPPPPAPSRAERAFWVLLAGAASLLLLAVTARLTRDIVPAPLLWVVPLSAYLLTFVLCFEWPRLYWRPIWLGFLLPVALVGVAYLGRGGFSGLSLRWRAAMFIGGFFLCCMMCHGEIARRRPGASWLTAFYLLVALGGALGGLVAGVVAPVSSVHLVEFPAGLILVGLCWVLASLQGVWPRLGRRTQLVATALLPLSLGVYAMYVVDSMRASTRGYLLARSFYGQLGVRDDGVPGTETASRTLVHGGTIHGTQWQDASRRGQLTTYYCETSGVGLALARLPTERPRRVGVIGLGTGTLAAYGRPGDEYRVYEIDPLVLRVAESEFTFLHDSRAEIVVVLGDARRTLEAEPPQLFDLLAVDAFSGDAIPAHLLTLEALELFLRHLAPDGILAIHVSNHYVDLQPVLAAAATELDRPALNVIAEGDSARICYPTQWILILPPNGRLRYATLWLHGADAEAPSEFRTWTDDRWSLYPVLRRGVR